MASTTKTASFTLGDHDLSFITEMVQQGRFGNKTEVVRAGLRLLEDYEANQKMKRLQALIAEGDADIQAGRVTAYSSADDLIDEITQ